MFNDERRSYARKRRAVIAANSELLERELIKMAGLTSAIGDALRRRGVSDSAASLAAETGIAVFRVTFDRWVDEAGDQDWRTLVRRSLEELKVLVGLCRAAGELDSALRPPPFRPQRGRAD